MINFKVNIYLTSIFIYKVEKILSQYRRKGTNYYLVKWKGYDQ